MTLQPGDFVRLVTTDQTSTYQLLNIDDCSGSCWVRRWPLTRHGSPAFAVPVDQLADIRNNSR
jgi:hypothetical protein